MIGSAHQLGRLLLISSLTLLLGVSGLPATASAAQGAPSARTGSYGLTLSEQTEDQALLALARSPLLQRLSRAVAPASTAQAAPPRESRVLRTAGTSENPLRRWGLVLLTCSTGAFALRRTWSAPAR